MSPYNIGIGAHRAVSREVINDMFLYVHPSILHDLFIDHQFKALNSNVEITIV